MTFLDSIVSRLRSGAPVSDAELERADRRAFLRGFSVTAAGLILPVPIVSVARPVKPFPYIFIQPIGDSICNGLSGATYVPEVALTTIGMNEINWPALDHEETARQLRAYLS